jgi:hypothetical protein
MPHFRITYDFAKCQTGWNHFHQTVFGEKNEGVIVDAISQAWALRHFEHSYPNQNTWFLKAEDVH